jgi:protein-S-isoprenylcysteine O-methyltransferase Ste14
VSYILIGAAGFLIIHAFDVISIKGTKVLKPVIWVVGGGLVTGAAVLVSLTPEKLALGWWATLVGWLLLAVSSGLIIYSLFINLPFRSTYLRPGVGERLVTTGFYALSRHPGVLWFGLAMVGLVLVSKAVLMVWAALVWLAMDIGLVVVQDIYFFPRMFPDYRRYQQSTPMLIPSPQSVARFMSGLNDVGRDENKNKVSKEVTMSKIGELFRAGRYEELWQMCCGFLDLDTEDFMAIQRRLLLEQIELLKNCELGRHIMNGANPSSVEEFRAKVPLTTYGDYVPYLPERQSSALPAKPLIWCHTSGRSGEYPFKWIPMTARMYDEVGSSHFANLILCGLKRKGEIPLEKGDKLLYALAPSPYISGVTARRIAEEDIVQFLPPPEKAEQMEFSERIQEGFREALLEGMDWFGGISSVLVAVGEEFSNGKNKFDLKPLLGHPKTLGRLMLGMTRAKLARRPLRPADIWHLKGIGASGTDSQVFRDRITQLWGCPPVETYGCTEAGGIIAMQARGSSGMTFLPQLNFLEFIPEEDSLRLRQEPDYQPTVLLLDEVKAGRNYEIVITSFYGGALVRYRIGDLIRITAIGDEKLGIKTPQMEFYSRVDDLIDLAGFTRLTEGTIWKAIENSGIPYAEWTARKEAKDTVFLHIYLEPKGELNLASEDVTASIDAQLRKLDPNYYDLVSYTRLSPLRVTLLSSGVFGVYMQKQREAGADLGHMKIPHINPSDKMIGFLLSGGKEPVRPRVPAKKRAEEPVEQKTSEK